MMSLQSLYSYSKFNKSSWPWGCKATHKPGPKHRYLKLHGLILCRLHTFIAHRDEELIHTEQWTETRLNINLVWRYDTLSAASMFKFGSASRSANRSLSKFATSVNKEILIIFSHGHKKISTMAGPGFMPWLFGTGEEWGWRCLS